MREFMRQAGKHQSIVANISTDFENLMFKKATSLLLSLLFVGSMTSYAQRLAINNNLVFDIDRSLSAGVEIPFVKKKTSIEIYGSIRPWKRGEESVHKHWLLQGQFRFWPCQVMNGFFFGPYVHGGEFNLGNHTMPFGLLNGLRSNRYEGWLLGAGFGVGYQLALAKHWNIGAEVGAGYTYINYQKTDCEVCGRLKKDDDYHYFGVSRLALSLIYIF